MAQDLAEVKQSKLVLHLFLIYLKLTRDVYKYVGVSVCDRAKGKEKDLPFLLNLTHRHPCGNMSSIVVCRCVLMELYPSSSPLGSCSHGRRAGASGTLPVAHIKEYEGCIQPACNSFVLQFPLPSDICAAYWDLQLLKPPSLHHYFSINYHLFFLFFAM